MLTERENFQSAHQHNESQLVKNVQAMFHFISDIESVNGWFNVRSAIRNGFLKEHQGTCLSTDAAEGFAMSKLKTIRKHHSDGLYVQFGNSFALVLRYDELANLLLQIAEMKWYRKIHTEIVSDVLLPSVEVHEAIAEYLSRANIKIDPNVVQKFLGINKAGHGEKMHWFYCKR